MQSPIDLRTNQVSVAEKLRRNIVNEWKPKSETWALRYGCYMLGGLSFGSAAHAVQHEVNRLMPIGKQLQGSSTNIKRKLFAKVTIFYFIFLLIP